MRYGRPTLATVGLVVRILSLANSVDKFFFPVSDVCIITALDVAYLRNFACHVGSHRLKVVIKNGDIVLLLKANFRTTERHLPVNCATPAMLWSRHLSRKDLLIYRPIDLKTISILGLLFSYILLVYCIH